MTVGARLKEERDRLGFSQEGFAALGGASKRSQIDWEKGVAFPNANFLAQVAGHGVDVRYVVTGEHDSSALSADEKRLLALYRLADEPLRKAALRVLVEGDVRQGDAAVVIHGQVGQSIKGNVMGPQTFHVGDVIAPAPAPPPVPARKSRRGKNG